MMLLHEDERYLIEAITTWAAVSLSLACYIVLPRCMSWPDQMKWSMLEPSSRPLKRIWILLPRWVQEELRSSSRLLLTLLLAACVLVGMALCIPTVIFWDIDESHATALRCLLSWDALVTCCLTIAEVIARTQRVPLADSL